MQACYVDSRGVLGVLSVSVEFELLFCHVEYLKWPQTDVNDSKVNKVLRFTKGFPPQVEEGSRCR